MYKFELVLDDNDTERIAIPVRRLSLAEYYAIGRDDDLADDERLELIDGLIVRDTDKSPGHAVCVTLIADFLWSNMPDPLDIRTRSGVEMFDSQLAPDCAVVHGKPRRYNTRFPGVGDIEMIVEVSESVVALDRIVKGRIYARSNIQVYWLVNLPNRQIEVYTLPTGDIAQAHYRAKSVYEEGVKVPLELGGKCLAEIAVADLLP